MMEQPKGPNQPLSRQEIEQELIKLRRKLADMEFDLKNGRYPNGVPVEYNDRMEEIKSDISNAEDALK